MSALVLYFMKPKRPILPSHRRRPLVWPSPWRRRPWPARRRERRADSGRPSIVGGQAPPVEQNGII